MGGSDCNDFLSSPGTGTTTKTCSYYCNSSNVKFWGFHPWSYRGNSYNSPAGIRSSTGDVILLSLGYTYSTTLYEVVANPGTIVSILNGPDVILPGSCGGSITLSVGASDPVSPFVTTAVPPLPTYLNIGGTITIGTTVANPPGSYSGTYDITFIQQ